MGPYGARGSSGAPPPHSLHAPHVGVGASVPRCAAPRGRPHNLWGPPTAPLCGVAGRITAPEPNPEWGGEEEEGVKMRVVMMMVMMKPRLSHDGAAPHSHSDGQIGGRQRADFCHLLGLLQRQLLVGRLLLLLLVLHGPLPSLTPRGGRGPAAPPARSPALTLVSS